MFYHHPIAAYTYIHAHTCHINSSMNAHARLYTDYVKYIVYTIFVPLYVSQINLSPSEATRSKNVKSSGIGTGVRPSLVRYQLSRLVTIGQFVCTGASALARCCLACRPFV